MLNATNIVEIMDSDGVILLERLPATVANLAGSLGNNTLSSIETQISALQELQNSVDAAGISALQADITTLQNNLTTETANRTSGDAALQADITTLQNNLTTETANRTSGDTALQADITTLQNNLTTETANRTSGDAALQADITTLQSSLLSIQSSVTTLDTEVKYKPTIYGPETTYVSSPTNYVITNFDINNTYSISVSSGAVSLSGDTITVTPTSTPGTITLTVDNNSYTLNTYAITIETPSIISPVSGSINIPSFTSLTGSSFAATSLSDTHVSSSWEIATDSGFSTIVQSSLNDTLNLTSWRVSGLLPNTTYFARVQYTGATYGASSWSQTISFTTKTIFYPNSISAAISPSRIPNYSYLGTSVSISDDGLTAVVGAPGLVVGRNKSQGGSYVYAKNGNAWSMVDLLTASDGAASDKFGTSVSMNSNGTVIVVGSPHAHIDTSASQGALYVFSLVNGSWVQTAKIVASDGMPNDYFGYSVSINSAGTVISGGATNRSVSGVNSAGVVYVYNYNGTSWLLAGELSSNTNTPGCNFGFSQSISGDGNTLVIGSPYKKIGSNSRQGAIYVYTYNGTVWSLVSEINSADGAANDNFGYSVDINGNGTIIVSGSPGKTVNGNSGQGEAYVYNLSTGVWSQTIELKAPNGASSDNFGHAVAMTADGSNIVIGAPYKTINRGTKQGVAYSFNYSTSWNQVAELVVPSVFGYAYMGYSLDIDSSLSTALIGATGYNSGTGIVYIGN